jgi:hypothetical protein
MRINFCEVEGLRHKVKDSQLAQKTEERLYDLGFDVTRLDIAALTTDHVLMTFLHADGLDVQRSGASQP